MIAIDTSIWIYSHDTRDSRKQAVAQQLIASASPLVLPWQVGCEFIAAARKLSSVGFLEADAWSALDDMQQMADFVALPDPLDWKTATLLQTSATLSFWDATLIAVCQRNGVTKLYSEDMGSPRTINDLELINPFK